MSTTERDEFTSARENAKGWLQTIEEMIAAFNAAQDNDERENAERTIDESVLSVLVRNGWRDPSHQTPEDVDAEEYEILLSTGGPALRVWGKLNGHAEPRSAELQMQDWRTPWTRYPTPEALLLEFAQRFYFGE